jgi:UDP-GlcNAc:undecaprenyl-phosphate GlcNAc-1-phosphate transferase
MRLNLYDLMPVAVAFALVVALTPLVRSLARRAGAVARPRSDRWHQQPTALLGGVAIFLAVVVACLTGLEHTPQTLAVLGGSTLLWLLGLVDDLVHLKPYQKLIGQVMGAAVVLAAGVHLPWTPWPLVNSALTIFWLVGITNAVNLLDNMDGLAGGVAAIAAGFLAVNCLDNGQTTEALLLGVLAAALLGFLVYNSNPASIFMGDCGSMFIGFLLASAALLHPVGGRSRTFLPVLAVPVLVLFIPIFDVTLVTALRKLAGRAVSQGGRDHTSHRLVALGLSERLAVALLYGLAILTGLLALLVRDLTLDLSLSLIAGLTVVLTLLGVYLAGVKVYEEGGLRAARQKPLMAFLFDLSHKRRLFEVLLDVVLILVSFALACVLRFGAGEDTGREQYFGVVPVLVMMHLGAFLAVGVYRGLWRYISVANLIVYAEAVGLGTLASALAVLVLPGLPALPYTLFVLHGLLLLLLLTGSRVAFRVFRSLLPIRPLRSGRRVLIYGAGDGGELLLRELLNNRGLGCVPVGFADDDPLKKGAVIHGLRVHGGNGSLGSICVEQRVEEVVISSTCFSEERVREIVRDCAKVCVSVKRMRITIEQLSALGPQEENGRGTEGNGHGQ